jgi:ribose transport system permease protein
VFILVRVTVEMEGGPFMDDARTKTLTTAVVTDAPVRDPDEQAGVVGRYRERTSLERSRDFLGRYGLVIVLLGFVVAFSLLLPNTFPTQRNFESIVNSQAIIMILALTATIVLRVGEFDLSIAATMTMTAAAAAVMTRDGVSFFVVLSVAVLLGVLIGVVNGFLIVKIGVSSFVTTLGMMTALGGAAYAITNSEVVFGIEGTIITIGAHMFLGFPLLTWYGWIFAVVLWYVYQWTPVGRYMLFVGGSPDSARLTGLRVDRIRILAFVASGVLSALCGILLAGYLAGLDPSVGNGYLLPPFAGAFLGAATITVGRFNAFGTVVGLYLLAVAITGLQLMGAPNWVTNVFNGCALVIAVTLARLVARRET